MEVQAHGNYYEDLKTRQITGLGKVEYDALKEEWLYIRYGYYERSIICE